MVFVWRQRRKDLLLQARVVVRTSNMKISRRRLSDYVKTLHQKACRTCSTIIFLHSTNQIIDLWRCSWRCRRQILSSLLDCEDDVSSVNPSSELASRFAHFWREIWKFKVSRERERGRIRRMHDYLRPLCHTTKLRFQRVVPCSITSVNSQSSENKKNSFVR